MSDGGASSQPGRNNAFTAVPGPRIQRSLFRLAHERKIPIDFGILYPCMLVECVPGDVHDLAQNLVIRAQAMLAPPLHGVTAVIDTFFVQTRNLWPKIDSSGNNWEEYIAGGVDGLNSATVPKWNVSATKHDVGSLWDMLGLPTWSTANTFSAAYPDAVIPLALPLYAYNNIWNEWYRDETLQVAVALTNEDLLTRAWDPDFYTKALPFQQRGTAPSFPIAGTTNAVFPGFIPAKASNAGSILSNPSANTVVMTSSGGAGSQVGSLKADLDVNTVNFGAAVTFGVSDIRLAVLIQRQLEQRARGGVRYTEFLQAIYGTHPKDENLNRPEFLGRLRVPIMISEVIQNSASNTQPTPQGNLAGHGIGVGRNHVARYECKDFGYLVSLLSIMPDPAYQQGVDRLWLRESRYDWPIPEWSGMSEQAVLNQEVYLAGDGVNKTIFGYQARFNEMRWMRNTVHGLFRTTLNYWHFGRIFATRPALNSSFVTIGSTELTSLKRVSAVPSQPMWLATVGNELESVRPFPEFGVPGLARV